MRLYSLLEAGRYRSPELEPVIRDNNAINRQFRDSEESWETNEEIAEGLQNKNTISFINTALQRIWKLGQRAKVHSFFTQAELNDAKAEYENLRAGIIAEVERDPVNSPIIVQELSTRYVHQSNEKVIGLLVDSTYEGKWDPLKELTLLPSNNGKINERRFKFHAIAPQAIFRGRTDLYNNGEDSVESWDFTPEKSTGTHSDAIYSNVIAAKNGILEQASTARVMQATELKEIATSILLEQPTKW